MTLALLCQFTAQHVSDVNTSIFRSLRLLGALLCRLYCAVMIEVYVLIYFSSSKCYAYIMCRVWLWVCSCKRVVSCGSWTFCVWYVLVFYASVLMTICMSCTYLTWGVLVLCSGIGCWWCGIREQAESLLTCSLWTVRVLGVYDRLVHAYGYHTNTHRTRTIQPLQ